jgi:hypothetical protein
MNRNAVLTGLFALGVVALTPASSQAAAYTRPASWVLDMPGSVAAPAQFWPRGPRYVGPRFVGPRGGFVYSRPWVRRPYYGTIVAGVVLGTIVTVAAVGMIPRRPAPDLCWYWADPYRNRGYWDYCY